jgi:peptidoglycan/LPS O-acetylase OafA/YrhL
MSGNPRPHSTDAATGPIPSLDGLRALSFLIVFISHAGYRSIIPGGFGVTVFFFLSGFLITTLLRLEHEQHGRINFRDFYLRRVLRIWPPFYTVLLLAVIGTATGLVGGRLLPAPLLAQALHFNNYWTIGHGTDGIPSGVDVYWSLAVEEHFYLLFPWILAGLYALIARPGRRAAVLWGLCLVILVWRWALVQNLGASENRTYMGSDTRFDSILFGCALALGFNPALDPQRGAAWLWKWVLFPAGLALLTFTFLYRGAVFRETWRYTAQGIALMPLFVVAIRHPGWGPMALLNLRPVKFVGLLSYSLYLLHHVVLGVFQNHLVAPRLVLALAALTVSLAIAWAIHVGIEKPAGRLRRRLSHAVVRAPADAPLPTTSPGSAPAADAAAP